MTEPIKIAVIPDTQVKPDQDLDYLASIGNYIVEKQPDAIVHLGDFADMPSLCVAPDTAVLRGDFSWSRAEDLRIGDDIIGFIGGKPGGKGKSFRKLRPGKVTNNTRFVAKSGYKITTEHGTVVCSHDHKFMSYNDDGAKRAFRTCAQLRAGWKIMSLGSDWLQPSGLTSTELGYLAGFLDGEGSYAQGRLTWSQNDGEVAAYVLSLFDKLQIDVGYYSSEVDRPNLKHYYVKGSYLNSWKVLHYCRPVRLLPKLIADMDGKTCSKFSGSKDSSIVSIEPLEGVEVIGLETDVNTYISNSLFSHNCSYDRGKKSFEGRRYKNDIAAAKEGMSKLLAPLYTYNDTHTRNKKRKYQPYMLMLLGNHEHRIERATNDDPKLEGTIGLCDLGYEGFGWEVSPFLKVEQVAGICFSHYFVSGVMGRPITSAQALLTKKHVSCIAGHQQGKQIATATRGDGKRITGIITGSCYPGHEEYLGPQGNEHWRGMLMCYEAIDGQFDEGFISLDYLRKRYS